MSVVDLVSVKKIALIWYGYTGFDAGKTKFLNGLVDIDFMIRYIQSRAPLKSPEEISCYFQSRKNEIMKKASLKKEIFILYSFTP